MNDFRNKYLLLIYNCRILPTYSLHVIADFADAGCLCSFRIPPPSVAHVPYITDVISDAIALGIVAFAISVSMAKIQARKHGYEVDSNQVHLLYSFV